MAVLNLLKKNIIVILVFCYFSGYFLYKYRTFVPPLDILAFKEYKKSSFEQTIKMLQKMQILAPDDKSIDFNIAVCQFRLKRFLNAYKKFENLSTNDTISVVRANSALSMFAHAMSVLETDPDLKRVDVLQKAIDFFETAQIIFRQLSAVSLTKSVEGQGLLVSDDSKTASSKLNRLLASYDKKASSNDNNRLHYKKDDEITTKIIELLRRRLRELKDQEQSKQDKENNDKEKNNQGSKSDGNSDRQQGQQQPNGGQGGQSSSGGSSSDDRDSTQSPGSSSKDQRQNGGSRGASDQASMDRENGSESNESGLSQEGQQQSGSREQSRGSGQSSSQESSGVSGSQESSTQAMDRQDRERGESDQQPSSNAEPMDKTRGPRGLPREQRETTEDSSSMGKDGVDGQTSPEQALGEKTLGEQGPEDDLSKKRMEQQGSRSDDRWPGDQRASSVQPRQKQDSVRSSESGQPLEEQKLRQPQSGQQNARDGKDSMGGKATEQNLEQGSANEQMEPPRGSPGQSGDSQAGLRGEDSGSQELSSQARGSEQSSNERSSMGGQGPTGFQDRPLEGQGSDREGESAPVFSKQSRERQAELQRSIEKAMAEEEGRGLQAKTESDAWSIGQQSDQKNNTEEAGDVKQRKVVLRPAQKSLKEKTTENLLMGISSKDAKLSENKIKYMISDPDKRSGRW